MLTFCCVCFSQSSQYAVYVVMGTDDACEIYVDNELICNCVGLPMALGLYAMCFYVFNLSFPEHSAKTLIFLQKFAFGLVDPTGDSRVMRMVRACIALMDRLSKPRQAGSKTVGRKRVAAVKVVGSKAACSDTAVLGSAADITGADRNESGSEADAASSSNAGSSSQTVDRNCVAAVKVVGSKAACSDTAVLGNAADITGAVSNESGSEADAASSSNAGSSSQTVGRNCVAVVNVVGSKAACNDAAALSNAEAGADSNESGREADAANSSSVGTGGKTGRKTVHKSSLAAEPKKCMRSCKKRNTRDRDFVFF